MPTKRTNEGASPAGCGTPATGSPASAWPYHRRRGVGDGAERCGVAEAARRHCEQVGLATVYRTLDLLDEIGGPNASTLVTPALPSWAVHPPITTTSCACRAER